MEYIDFQNITKVFPGQKALSNVSFGIRKGEIHALVGENGAGKSTLLNILHGVFPATEGKVFIDNEEVRFGNTLDAIKFGIAKVHQEINIIPEMTVTQNVMLGTEIKKKSGLLDIARMNQETQKLLDKLGCDFSPTDQMKNLSTGKKQLTQIAKALYLNAKIVSFDEPTSSLSNNEVAHLFDIIRQMKEHGITVIYISHKMDEIFNLCDRVSVLRDGQYITTMDIKETLPGTLVQKMVGRDVSMFAKRRNPSCANPEETVLKVDGLCGPAGFSNISFHLSKGEILGFFGLVGAMRTEVMRAIFGADKAASGNIEIFGKKVSRNTTPEMSVNNKIGMVSENRKEEGFVKTMDNADNIALSSIDRFKKRGFVNRRLKEENSNLMGGRVGLTPNRPDFMTMSLSGGNAQKVIIAKWLSSDVDILIMDEPTKGIDIGAKAEIYALMEELVAEGKSIIMISSELPEVMGMSDRIIVMRAGSIAREFAIDEFSEQDIIKYAVGVSDSEKVD